MQTKRHQLFPDGVWGGSVWTGTDSAATPTSLVGPRSSAPILRARVPASRSTRAASRTLGGLCLCAADVSASCVAVGFCSRGLVAAWRLLLSVCVCLCVSLCVRVRGRGRCRFATVLFCHGRASLRDDCICVRACVRAPVRACFCLLQARACARSHQRNTNKTVFPELLHEYCMV